MSAEQRALAIADKIVPAYRAGGRRYSCTGNVAQMWQAAYDGALAVLTPEPTPARPVPVGEQGAREAAHDAAWKAIYGPDGEQMVGFIDAALGERRA